MIGRIVGAVLGAVVSASPAIAAGPQVTAPGRVAFPGAAATAIQALPDGGSVLAGSARGGLDVGRLRVDGSLDRAFGIGGMARIALPRTAVVAQMLLQPDGAIVVVAIDTSSASNAVWILRVSANGTLDADFGDRGIAKPPIHTSSELQQPAALAADGSIVIAGSTGTYGRSLRPAVAMLTPAGRMDVRFGGGVVSLPGSDQHDAGGFNAAITPRGQIVVAYAGHIAALTPGGAPDLSFNGGTPVSLPGTTQVIARPDGSIDALSVGRSSTRIVRFTSAGARDRGFGARGTVRLRSRAGARPLRLLLGADDATTLVEEIGPGDPPAGEHAVTIDLHRITSDGRLQPRATLSPRFGGGGASADVLFPLVQNGFHLWDIASRPDGSYLVAGNVDVLRRSEGGSHGTRVPVVAAFTPTFAPDRTFGGAAGPTLSVRPRTRRRMTILKRGALPLLLTASAPGLVHLTLRDTHGRLLANRVAPIFGNGQSRISIYLTRTTRLLLSRSRASRLLLKHEFRDLLAESVTSTDTIQLR